MADFIPVKKMSTDRLKRIRDVTHRDIGLSRKTVAMPTMGRFIQFEGVAGPGVFRYEELPRERFRPQPMLFLG